MIEKYLADLETRIDPDVEEELLSQWKEFCDGGFRGGIFSPRRGKACPPQVDWPQVLVNEALGDFEKMALQQLSGCSQALAAGSGAIMAVRANYGTGILPSVFGAEVFVMDEQLDTLPTTKPLPGGSVARQRLVDAGMPDLRRGYGERTFAMGRYFSNIFSRFPKIAKHVCVYHPDLQGPMDVCELLWGSELFLALINEIALVKAMLELITETYIQFMHQWNNIVSPESGYAVHWSLLHKGSIMLRDDSAMNLSPEMFDLFIRPYDQGLLDEFGGGAIHFCGRGDHYISRLSRMKGVYAVAMSQPECNKMKEMFSNTVDKGIQLIGLQRQAAEAALKEGRELQGNVHCW